MKKIGNLSGSINHNREHKDLDYTKKDGPLFTWENESVRRLEMPDVHKYERETIQELDKIVKEKTGRKSQIKNHFVDGLLSLGREQYNSLDDRQKRELAKDCCRFVQDFTKKHGVRLMHFSVHFDEGYTDEKGQWQDNAHCQFNFENVNRQTGKAVLSRLTKKDLQQLQTDFATKIKKYGFERGRDYHAEGLKAPKQEDWKQRKRRLEQQDLDKAKEIIKQQEIKHKQDIKDTEINTIISIGTKTQKAIEEKQKELIRAIAISFGDVTLDTAEKIKERAKELRQSATDFNKSIADYAEFEQYKLNRKNYHLELEKLAKEKTLQLEEISKLDMVINAKISVSVELDAKIEQQQNQLTIADLSTTAEPTTTEPTKDYKQKYETQRRGRVYYDMLNRENFLQLTYLQLKTNEIKPTTELKNTVISLSDSLDKPLYVEVDNKQKKDSQDSLIESIKKTISVIVDFIDRKLNPTLQRKTPEPPR
jgi:hypothetical protein